MNTHDQSWAQIKQLSRQRVIVINVDRVLSWLYPIAFVIALLCVYALVDLHERQVEIEISSASPEVFCPTNIAGLSIRCDQLTKE
jgi:hypothetical protein